MRSAKSASPTASPWSRAARVSNTAASRTVSNFVREAAVRRHHAAAVDEQHHVLVPFDFVIPCDRNLPSGRRLPVEPTDVVFRAVVPQGLENRPRAAPAIAMAASLPDEGRTRRELGRLSVAEMRQRPDRLPRWEAKLPPAEPERSKDATARVAECQGATPGEPNLIARRDPGAPGNVDRQSIGHGCSRLGQSIAELEGDFSISRFSILQ